MTLINSNCEPNISNNVLTLLFLKVVVLSAGDLTEEQAKHAEKEAATKPREATDEKIVFKKPTKKETDNDNDKTNEKKKKSTAKKVKNASLLSFNQEDEEEN